jgi:small GTP-binding protein
MSSTDLKKRLLKIIIVGSTEVGKSCLMERYNDLDFEESYVPTFGDFFMKEIELDDTAVSAKIWDLGSTLALGTTFLRGTHGVILVADITSKKSFKALDSIYESVKRLVGFADDSFPCIVVLNKLDLVSDSNVTNSNQTTVECQSNLRQISKVDVQQWSKDRRSYGEDPITFYEVSAKDGTNVNLMFESIIRLALSTNIQMSVNPSASIKASIFYYLLTLLLMPLAGLHFCSGLCIL